MTKPKSSIALQMLAVLLALALFAVPRAFAQDNDGFEEFKRYLVGNPKVRDQPRAVNKPQYIPVTDASLYLDPSAIVFVEEPIAGEGRPVIYPRDILVHHEIVNIFETDGSIRSITYSPLTGSVIGFKGEVRLHATAFGTMAQYLNMNRVYYDRATNSIWPQILGQSISGPLRGERLSRFPLLWTRWKYARDRYPKARVLSRQTGHRMPYNRDPYGSYQRDGTWYTTGNPTMHIMHKDNRLGPKERILGFAAGFAAVAFQESALKKYGVASASAGMEPLVAMYDPRMDAIRVFHAEAEGKELTFTMTGGEIVDQQTRSRWTPEGLATEGRLRGMYLERAAAMDAMWFAWIGFYPNTLLWTAPGSTNGF